MSKQWVLYSLKQYTRFVLVGRSHIHHAVTLREWLKQQKQQYLGDYNRVEFNNLTLQNSLLIVFVCF